MKCLCEPNVVRSALEPDQQVRRGISKLIGVVGSLSFGELMRHNGVHLEKLVNLTDPVSGLPLYSPRATSAARVTAIVRGDELHLLAVHAEHHDAYKRR